MDRNEMGQEPSFEQQARRYLGDNGIGGDVVNAYFHVTGELDETNPKPARTYEDYIRNVKCAKRPKFADAIMQLCDRAKVAQFDNLIMQLNAELQKRVSAAEKSKVINPILDELEKIV